MFEITNESEDLEKPLITFSSHVSLLLLTVFTTVGPLMSPSGNGMFIVLAKLKGDFHP